MVEADLFRCFPQRLRIDRPSEEKQQMAVSEQSSEWGWVCWVPKGMRMKQGVSSGGFLQDRTPKYVEAHSQLQPHRNRGLKQGFVTVALLRFGGQVQLCCLGLSCHCRMLSSILASAY